MSYEYQKKAGIAIFMSNSIVFKAKRTIKDKYSEQQQKRIKYNYMKT